MSQPTDACGLKATEVREATDDFVRREHGSWTEEDETLLTLRLSQNGPYADAYRGTERSWRSLDAHAAAAEMLGLRRQAIAWMGRIHEGRRSAWYLRPRCWRPAASIAAIALIVLAGPLGLYIRSERTLYSTGIGEQRSFELSDHSRIALDAASQLEVRFTDAARTVRLIEGQAQFSVAKDPTRPFVVQAGDRRIVAIGTVFTVEYLDRSVHVAMMEGRVLVAAPDPTGQGLRLSTGEELRVDASGRETFLAKADLAAATAWRSGHLIFRNETLGDAVRRLNRYSRRRISVGDSALGSLRISGVFEIGDTDAFARSVQAYYPVIADDSESGVMVLRLKH